VKPQGGGGGRSQIVQAPTEFDQLKPHLYPRYKRVVTLLDEIADEQRRKHPKADHHSQVVEKQVSA
jgi:hypothetical protein